MTEFDKGKVKEWFHIRNSEILTKELIYDEEFRKWINQFDNYDEIFPKYGRNEKGQYPLWKVKTKCNVCGKELIFEISRTAFLSWLKNSEKLICDSCKAKAQERTKQEKIILSEIAERDYKTEKNKNTQNYISIYLNSNNSWKNDTHIWDMKNQVLQANYLNEEEIAEYIRSMDYKDFLQTPYWKAISLIVKKKHNFKCALCGVGTWLNVHHPTYDIHGYEHRNLDELIPLCRECHEIHHKVIHGEIE